MKKTYFLLLIILSTTLFIITCNNKIVKQYKKKQVIIISIDTLRADHLGFYGYQRNTSPGLDKLAKESVCYMKAYTNGCWTIPSHVSLLTGTLPSRHGINKNWKSLKDEDYPEINDSLKNIAEILKLHNINTLKFAALPDELGFARGFNTNRRVDPFANNKSFNNLLKAIENNKDDNFLFFIHTWRVHAPYTNSFYLKKEKADKEKREYINNFREIGMKKKSKNISNDFAAFLRKNKLYNVKDCVDLYDGGIRYVDQFIERLIDKLKKLGIYSDLMFIVVSDHGEHFAEHFRKKFYGCHGEDFFDEFIKIPLIIKYPNLNKPQTINRPVSIIDVFPTILDYYDIKIPAYAQGESLLNHNKRNRNYIISEATWDPKVEKKMIMIGDLKYIITMKDPVKPERINWSSIVKRKLYDLKNDPLEKKNLYKFSKFKKIGIEFEKMLKKIIKNSAKFNSSTKKTRISKETFDQLKSLGYL